MILPRGRCLKGDRADGRPGCCGHVRVRAAVLGRTPGWRAQSDRARFAGQGTVSLTRSWGQTRGAGLALGPALFPLPATSKATASSCQPPESRAGNSQEMQLGGGRQTRPGRTGVGGALAAIQPNCPFYRRGADAQGAVVQGGAGQDSDPGHRPHSPCSPPPGGGGSLRGQGWAPSCETGHHHLLLSCCPDPV